MTVPMHRHEVALDYLHVEFEAAYAMTDRWDLVGRIPFDIKRQTASLGEIAPVAEDERASMLRNINLHHRSETHSGPSDLMVLAARRGYGLFHPDDALKMGVGITLPTGRTEPDPYELGSAGREHLHIQFGTGTFDPWVELNFRTPVGGGVSVGMFVLARVPLYENRKSYRGPPEITSGLNLGHRLGGRWSVQANLTHYYQGYARWDGARDDNSGLGVLSGTVGGTLRVSARASLGADMRFPIWHETLSSEGDAFEQGPTLLLRISRELRSGGVGTPRGERTSEASAP